MLIMYESMILYVRAYVNVSMFRCRSVGVGVDVDVAAAFTFLPNMGIEFSQLSSQTLCATIDMNEQTNGRNNH